jgi:hypothetical protein
MEKSMPKITGRGPNPIITMEACNPIMTSKTCRDEIIFVETKVTHAEAQLEL